MRLLPRARIAAFCVVGLTLGSGLLGCNVQVSFSGEDSKETQDQVSTSSSTTSNSSDTSPAPASSSSATDDAPELVAARVPEDDDPLPTGYVLDETCEIGAGQTGLDIYYKLAPSDSLRYACVHRDGKSPYLNYQDSAFVQNLTEVGGPYCAFSGVSNNVGCALSPITTADLMNVPPAEEEQEQPVKSKQQAKNKQPKQSKQSVQSKQPSQDQQSTPSNDGAGGLSNNKYYKNVDGIDVHSPAYSTDGSVPEGVTSQCADGTYSFSQHRRGTCSSHGGVSQWLP